MKKIYIGQLMPGKSYLPILYPNLGAIDRPERLFFNYAKAFPEKFFELTEDPETADYLMIPHDFFLIAMQKEFIRHYIDLASTHGKSILIFDHSDLDEEILVPRSIIFRVSQYRYKLKRNEIIIPPIIEDLGAAGIAVRSKAIEPVVGFCGWAGFKNIKDRLRYAGKVTMIALASVTDQHAAAHKPGLYFRRAAISAVKSSERLQSNFIIRRSYSGHRDSIGLDAVAARREYVENIMDSDFVLAPKGDGNYSNRFYETMSLGRIPILIDTECVLPLEREIDYSQIILRVPHDGIDELPNLLLKRWSSLSEDGYSQLQRSIRTIFENKLDARRFFKEMFHGDALKRYEHN